MNFQPDSSVVIQPLKPVGLNIKPARHDSSILSQPLQPVTLNSSLSADSVVFRQRPLVPAVNIDSIAATIRPEKLTIPVRPLDTATTILARPPEFTAGIEPTPRPYNTVSDSMLPAVFVVLILTIAFNFRPICRLVKTSARELFSMRRRENVFDDHTASETRAGIFLIVQLCLCGGVLAYFGLTEYFSLPAVDTVLLTAETSGVCAAYFLFQTVTYALTGYTFADDPRQAGQWLKSFFSCCELLSLLMLVPAIVTVFIPEYAYECVCIGIVLFLTAKFVFIIKGFRIFFNNFASWIYFILYLCSLEIIPVMAVLSGWLHVMGIDLYSTF